MFCTKCGASMAEGSLFCTKCGAKLSKAEGQTDNAEQGVQVSQTDNAEQNAQAGQADNAEQNAQVSQTDNAEQSVQISQTDNAEQGVQAGQTDIAEQGAQVTQTGNFAQESGGNQTGSVWQAAAPPTPEQQKKNTGVIIAAIVAFAAVLTVFIILISFITKPSINLTSQEVVEIEFGGGDTRGTATYKVDYDDIEDIGKKVLGKKPSDKKSILWFAFMASIDYDIDPNSNLTNGDKITLSVKWDEKSAKQLGIRVKGKDRKITVSGLEKATEVDVFKSLDVTFEGYNGNGTVDIDNTATDKFSYSIYFDADKSDGLSNGDKVKITAEVSDSVLNKYNYILKETEKEYTVSGLEEMQALDLFSGLKVEYSGTAPFAKIKLDKDRDNEFIDYYVSYEADKSENLKNGDVVTVTALVDEDYAASYGYTISETTKQYTVEGLDEYLTSYSDITEETFEKMESQAEDAIDSWIVKQEKWYDYQDLKIGEPEHVGNCFLKLKEGLNYGWGNDYENALYMCYKAEKTFKENDRKKTEDVYLIVRYDDFLKYGDGTIYVEIVSASVDGTTYGTYEDFYENVIRAKKEDYTVEEYKEKE